MKKIVLLLMAVLTIPSVLADYGHTMGYGMMGEGNGFYMAYGIVWFTIATFVFSVIFWTTYRLIVKEKRNRK